MSKSKGKTSKIKFYIELDENNVPHAIEWNASDSEHKENKKCKSISIAIWDTEEKNTLSIGLWTKEMLVDEMNSHFLQTVMTLAENFQRATNQEFVMDETKAFCENIANKIKEKNTSSQ